MRAANTAQIHPTAIVADSAVLGEGSTVGPYAVVGPHVRAGRNTTVHSHAIVEGHTIMGDGNTIFPFAAVGGIPQDLKYSGEESTLELGDGNIIREYVTLHPGTRKGGMRTLIGSTNLFMANCHVGHDCRVGSGNIFANSCALAGHVTIADRVTLGGLCGVHQFVSIGELSLIGAGAMVSKDVPPYCIAQGDRATLRGLNGIGLRRNGFEPQDIIRLRRLYRMVFWEGGTMSNRITRARIEFASFEAGQKLLDFIESARRGVAYPARRRAAADESDGTE